MRLGKKPTCHILPLYHTTFFVVQNCGIQDEIMAPRFIKAIIYFEYLPYKNRIRRKGLMPDEEIKIYRTETEIIYK